MKGGEPVTHAIRDMPGAVVISDVLSELKESLPDDQAALLVWPGFRQDDQTVEAVFAMNRARDLASFQKALTGFHSPVQNIHYADARGNIALFVPGRIPVRGQRDGTFPVLSDHPESRWTGYIPEPDLPRVINPVSDLIVNANNRLVPPDYPYPLTAVWPAFYRVDHIRSALATAREGRELTVSARLQNDNLSLPAKRLSPYLKASLLEAGKEELAARIAAWDYRMAADRPEPALYAVWERSLLAEILSDELDEDFKRYWRGRPRLLERIMAEGSPWCDDRRIDGLESCRQMSARALETALSDLADWLGADWRDWRWGALHEGRFDHDIFKHVPVADHLFGRVLPTDGGDHTVNRGQTGSGGSRQSFRHLHGAGFRAIYDLSDLKNSRFALAGGQSGHPMSGWFANLLEDWRDGRYIKITGAGKEILTLLPVE